MPRFAAAQRDMGNMMKKWFHFMGSIKRFRKDQRGVAYIEFALVMPILMLFLGGVIDVTRLVLIHSKVDKAVFTVGDLVTQINENAGANAHCTVIKELQDNVITAIMRPFPANIGTYGNYDFAVTSVLGTYQGNNTNGPTKNMVEWRYDRGTDATNSYVYKGVVNASDRYKYVASLPSSLGTLDRGERLIATEMFYKFYPIVPSLSFLDIQTIHKISYFRGRVTTGREGRNSGLMSATCS